MPSAKTARSTRRIASTRRGFCNTSNADHDHARTTLSARPSDELGLDTIAFTCTRSLR
jgi:hypothetical protein